MYVCFKAKLRCHRYIAALFVYKSLCEANMMIMITELLPQVFAFFAGLVIPSVTSGIDCNVDPCSTLFNPAGEWLCSVCIIVCHSVENIYNAQVGIQFIVLY